MRHFFIKSLDMLIGLFVVLGALGVLVAAVAASTGAMAGPTGALSGGIGAALVVLVVGLLYIAFIAGFLYLGVGIYHNTRRTAEAVEAMARTEPLVSRET